MALTNAWLQIFLYFAVPLALVVSLALRWVYLRAVWRSMLRPVVEMAAPAYEASPAPPTFPAPADPPSQRLEIVPAATPARDAVRAAWRGPWIAVAVHAVAGLAYALAMTVAWLWVGDMVGDIGWHAWEGTLLFTLFFVWPLVIVVGLVATVSWRAVSVVVLIYAALFFVGWTWGTQGMSFTLPTIALMWLYMNGIGTLLLVFLARPIRAVGPLVVALIMAATAGVVGIANLMNDHRLLGWNTMIATNVATALGFSDPYGFIGPVETIAVALLGFGLPALATGLVGYIALRGVGRLYKAQRISDQSIEVDAVLLVFAVVQNPQQPLAGLAAFVIYELVVRLGLRLFCPGNRADSQPPRLLLLRVFSLGRRSESLFRDFSLLWRYTGSVRMIAGPDLANATVEPHEFLDFLAGRLQRRFITGPAALDQRLAETSLRRDPDWRFRVFEFFCHADTWQTVLRRLARESDLVLMDLRGFTSTNKGCIFELNELLDAVRLERLLLVVDHTTDEGFLTVVLRQGWVHISASSPNRTDASPRVRLYRLDGAGAQGIGGLVATLADAHGRSRAPAAA